MKSVQNEEISSLHLIFSSVCFEIFVCVCIKAKPKSHMVGPLL